MTNSTQYYWSVDGVSLQTYAYNIETWGGDAQSPPPLRGGDTVIPYAVGETYHRKVPGARTISFGMWVVGANKDGSIPQGGSSRKLFEENWRKLRSLLWNPNRQIELTKRFKDWTTGQMVEATAKAEFAGGLAPTMNGTQRAVFTVQLRLADPFFYGKEKTVSINAMVEEARNYAKNPTPSRNAVGYSTVVPDGLTSREVVGGERFTVDGLPTVEAFYLNQPTTKDGGIAYGGTSKMLLTVPGEARKYSATFRSTLGGIYQAKVRFYNSALGLLGTQITHPTLTVEPDTWFTLPAATATAPATAAYAQFEIVEHPTSGRIPRPCTINRAPNPDFRSVGIYQRDLTNLFPNPSFETTSGSYVAYRNIFANSGLEQESSSVKVTYNLLTNPKFSNGVRGWFQDGADPGVPARALSVGVGGPVGGAYMSVTSQHAGGGVFTQYIDSRSSNQSRGESGTVHGVSRIGVGPHYGSAWVRCPNATQSVTISLVEVRANKTKIATTTQTVSVGSAWTRISVSGDKRESATTMHLRIGVVASGVRTFHVSGAMLTNNNILAGYFDGDGYLQIPSGRTDESNYPAPRTVKWAGARNASRSEIRMPVPSGISIPSTRIGYVTTARRIISGKTYTDRALYLVRADRSNPDISYLNYGAHIYTTTANDVGKVLTVVADAEIPSGYSAVNDTALSSRHPSRSIYIEDHGTAYPERAQAPSTQGIHSVRAKITPTESGQIIRLSGGGTATTPMGWKNITIVRGEYDGPAFTGARKGKSTSNGPWDVATPAWTGTSPWTPSELVIARPKETTPSAGVITVSSTGFSSEGTKSLEIRRGPSATPEESSRGSRMDYLLRAKRVYTVAVQGHIPAGYSDTLDASGARSLQIVGNSRIILGTLPSTPGTYTLQATVTPDSLSHIELGGSGSYGHSVYWDKLTIVEGDKEIEPFTGSSSSGNASIKYSWQGQAHNSPSVRSVAPPVGYESPVNALYANKLSASTYGGVILNTLKEVSSNLVSFTDVPDLFGYRYGYDAYTVMLKVRAYNLVDGEQTDSTSRRIHLRLADGRVMQSPQFAKNGTTQLRWTFDRPTSAPVSMELYIGQGAGKVEISEFALIPVKYDGSYFSGNSAGAYWWGAPNASESQMRGDRYYMTKVLVTKAGYTGAYFDGDTPNTGTGDSAKTYSWAGVRSTSESIYSVVNLTGVDIDLDGDYYTRKVKVIATPPVGAYSIVAKTGDIEPQGYKYTLGVQTKVTVDVEDFSVSVAGQSGDFAYAVEPTKEGYWLELSPGINTLLLRGVGTGKLEVKYRAAWI